MDKSRKTINIIGILAGALSIVMSIVTFCLSTGLSESNSRYGGDAYTGIQNAAAQSANNIMYSNIILKIALGSLLLVVGIVLICYFVGNLKKQESELTDRYNELKQRNELMNKLNKLIDNKEENADEKNKSND